MQTRRSKFSPYRVEAAEPISHLATISSTLAAARVSSARLRPSPAETFGLSIICSPKWSVEGLCPPPNLPPILQPHQPPFPAVLTWTSNSILAILSIVLFSWNIKRDWSLCKKTRPDTRQYSRGRFGRSGNAKTACNSEIWPTDGPTDRPIPLGVESRVRD